VLLTYIEATDTTAHLFSHLFRAKGLSGELAAQQERYGHAVEQMYRYADQIVGEYLQVPESKSIANSGGSPRDANGPRCQALRCAS
jgi:hypothetical protein